MSSSLKGDASGYTVERDGFPLFGNFNYPSSYRLGVGRLSELGALSKEAGISRPLIVTDEGVKGLPWFPEVIRPLNAAGISHAVFSDVDENPIEENVTQGVDAYRQHQADGIILLGGGSPHDVGKCIALRAGNPGSVFDYEDVGDNWRRIDPSGIAKMIAIPTTSGTGSEVGRAAVIINAASEKKLIFHPRLQPGWVLADPALTFGLPPALTAYTGIDAFIHSLEAFSVPSYHPMADAIALEGMRLVNTFLPRAFSTPNDAEARTQLMVASSMGAMAFQKGLGVIHAISHALGGLYRIHHGKANAILLPHCLPKNRGALIAQMSGQGAHNKATRIAQALDLDEPGDEAVYEWTLKFRAALGVPHTLAELTGLSSHLEKVAAVAMKDPSMSGNPTPLSKSDVIEILESALGG